MGGFMSGRATANLLTRATAVIAAFFMATSLTLAILSGETRESRSILDRPAATEESQPKTPQAPAAPLTE